MLWGLFLICLVLNRVCYKMILEYEDQEFFHEIFQNLNREALEDVMKILEGYLEDLEEEEENLVFAS